MTVIVPWESGSGKLGTPWERMQAVYLTPAVLPTVIDMLPAMPAPPGGGAKASAPLTLLADAVVPRLATEDDREPPHPDTSNEAAARSDARRAAAPSIVRREACLSETTLKGLSHKTTLASAFIV